MTLHGLGARPRSGSVDLLDRVFPVASPTVPVLWVAGVQTHHVTAADPRRKLHVHGERARGPECGESQGGVYYEMLYPL